MCRRIEQLPRFLKSVTSFQLDSTAAKEVMASVGALARREGIIVIASIHQPSYATLSEFSSLVILSQGVVCYRGKVTGLQLLDADGR